MPATLPDWVPQPPPCPLGEQALDLAVIGQLERDAAWLRPIVERPVDEWEALIVAAGKQRTEALDQPAALLLRAYAAHRSGAPARVKGLLSKAAGASDAALALASYIRGLSERRQGYHLRAATYFERAARFTDRSDLQLLATYRLGWSHLDAGDEHEALVHIVQVLRTSEQAASSRPPIIGALGCIAERELAAPDQEARDRIRFSRRIGGQVELRLLERIAAVDLASGTAHGARLAQLVYRHLLGQDPGAPERLCDWLGAWTLATGRVGDAARLKNLGRMWPALTGDPNLDCGERLPISLGAAAQAAHAIHPAGRQSVQAREKAQDVLYAYEAHLLVVPKTGNARLETLHYQARLASDVAIAENQSAGRWSRIATRAGEVARLSADAEHAAEAHRLTAIAYHNALALEPVEKTRREACAYLAATADRPVPPQVVIDCPD